MNVFESVLHRSKSITQDSLHNSCSSNRHVLLHEREKETTRPYDL